jgi:NADPH2:quinone reductase
MKAVRVYEFGGPEVLRLEETPEPQAGPTQIVVRLAAVGVNPVDTYIRTGAYAQLPPLPYTPGADGAGTVESVGEGAGRFKAGDRVYVAGSASGTYAELVLCEERQAHALPASLTFAQGAAVGVPYATACRALFQRAGARAGEAVLVHGASGGVGTAAVQLARAAGLRVAGTAGTDDGLRLAEDQGAHFVANHREPGYEDSLRDFTDGRGFDVILEMLANVNLDRDLDLLARSGRVVVVGSRGRTEIDPRKAMTRDAAVLGMTLLNVSAEDYRAIHAALAEGLGSGQLRPVVGREMPLAEAARAHREVLEPGAKGKIVLIP